MQFTDRLQHLFISLCFILLTSTISAQQTIIKLPTDTDASNFQIQNNSGTALFLTKGDALFELNGLPFITRDDDNNGQLVLRRNSNANEQMIFGFHSGDYGFIQTIEQNVAYRNLYLNGSGGNVGIGANSAGEKLTVAGKVYSTSGGFKFPDGTEQTTAATTSATFWTASSDDIYNSNSGKVGIGTTTPKSIFDVNGLTLLRTEAAMWQSEQRALVFGQYGHSNPMGDRRHEVLSRVDNTYSGNYLKFRIHDGQSADGSTFGYPLTLYGNSGVAMAGAISATGLGAVAMGLNSYCEANTGLAAGFMAIVYSDDPGSFVFNDGSSVQLTSSNPNEWVASFSGGYRFYSNTAHNLGASMPANQNGWGSVSDSTKKENHLKVDGEYFLNSISKLKLGSWNYKGQDSKEFRHYGPMAQEIFHYFGNDGIGQIGCDTLLMTTDMDGIMMIALQALENRTTQLILENKKLENYNLLAVKQVELLEEKVNELKTTSKYISALEQKLLKMEELVMSLQTENRVKVAKH